MIEDPAGALPDETPVAAEYVLGLLDPAQRRAFETLLETSLSAKADLTFWETRLGALAAEVHSSEPSPELWDRIETALARRHITWTSQVWNSLPLWRFVAIASAATAAASLLALVYIGHTLVFGEPLFARLDLDNGRGAFVATFDQGRTDLTIVPASVSAPDKRVLELWLIVPGNPPRSLGLIEKNRPARISVPKDLTPRISVQSALAVSLEPPGGSPTGLPTGPIVAKGSLTAL